MQSKNHRLWLVISWWLAGSCLSAPAGAALRRLPNRMTVQAHASIRGVAPGPLWNLSGATAHPLSWSKDGKLLALLRKSEVVIVSAATLNTRRVLPLHADTLGERCFAAVTRRTVQHGPGLARVIALSGNGRQTLLRASLPPEGARLALADDCSLSVAGVAGETVQVFRVAQRAASYTQTELAGGGGWQGALSSSGHFIHWNLWHMGYVNTRFQDLRRHDAVGPYYGYGSLMSPGDRTLLDTGIFSLNGDDHFNKRPSLVDVASGRKLYTLQIVPRLQGLRGAPPGLDAATFSRDGMLVAVAAGRRVWLYTPARRKPLAWTKLGAPPRALSFSPNDRLLVAASAKTVTALRLRR